VGDSIWAPGKPKSRHLELDEFLKANVASRWPAAPCDETTRRRSCVGAQVLSRAGAARW